MLRKFYSIAHPNGEVYGPKIVVVVEVVVVVVPFKSRVRVRRIYERNFGRRI